MKVAVVLADARPTIGGAFTFEESLRAALENTTPSDLEFVYFSINQVDRHVGEVSHGKRSWFSRAWAWGLRRIGLVTMREFNQWKHEIESELLKKAGSWNTDNPLNRAIISAGCQLVYFISPSMVPVDLPFVATHWDLGHRISPVFPEVSLSGWTWGQREWYYTHWLPRASRILTGTQTGKDQLVTAYGIHPDSIVINPFPVPSWLENTTCQRPAQMADNEAFLYYPAQFWPHKNHIVLIEALRLLKQEGIEINLVLTGSDKGNRDFVMQKVREFALEGNVTFLGFVTREELHWLYRNTALMVFPCLLGPDNLPPLEALASGVPVALADIPGAREYVPTGSVYFFDPTDEAALASLIRTVLDEPHADRLPAPEGIPHVQDYARLAVSVLGGLVPYRRCWGESYQHL